MASPDALTLVKRTATVTNLNFQPEKAGDELVERVDLSLEMLLEPGEINSLVRTRWQDATKVLFDDKGEPQFADVDSFRVDTKAEGTVMLAMVGADDEIEFDPSVLKKISVEPIIGRKANMRCQIRIDPAGHLEALGHMRIEQRCQFMFTGKRNQTQSKNQNELNV